MISITGRLIGMQKPLFEPWSIAIEPYLDGSDEWTLSELIEMVVLEASTIFKEPPHDPTFLRSINAIVVSEPLLLPDATIGEQSPTESHVGEAIGNALQAFEEDVFLVVLDGEDVMDLEDEIDLHPDSQVSFVRLVP